MIVGRLGEALHQGIGAAAAAVDDDRSEAMGSGAQTGLDRSSARRRHAADARQGRRVRSLILAGSARHPKRSRR